MNLHDIHQREGMEGLRRLAIAIGTSPIYLHQIATRLRFPSPQLAWRLVAADRRIRFTDLYRDARPGAPGLRASRAKAAQRKTLRKPSAR